MTTMELNVSPLGQVEGDLDVRVQITDGVVTDAWTEAAMFRGFEIILKGKDPQAGLIMTPRICGICGGSHLYKACYALDTAWGTYVPPNATRVRNIAQACETLQSIPRWFYAIMGPDLTAAQYSSFPSYEEVARRFAPYVGTSYQTGVTLSQHPVEIYAIFGGSVAALVVHDPGRGHERADAVGCHPLHLDPGELGPAVARGSVAGLFGGPLAGEQDLERHPGLDDRERVPGQQRPDAVHQVGAGDRPRHVRSGLRQLPGHRHVPQPGHVHPSDGGRPQRGAAVTVGHLRRTASTTTSTSRGSPRTSRTPSTRGPARDTRGRVSPNRSTRPRAPSRASTRGPRRPDTTCPISATYRSRWVRWHGR